MSAGDHLQPELFDPGPRLSAEEQDRREHERQGQQVAAFGEVAISVPRSVVPDIQRLGSIRTQHETERSQGAFNPQLRHELESAMGYDDAPVYGYLRRSPSEEPPYGGVDFRLKSSVKDRTYMHPGDSLNNYHSNRFAPGRDILSDNAAPESARVRDVTAGVEPAPTPQDDIHDYENLGYVEAHILPDQRPETLGLIGPGLGYASRVPLSDVRKASIHEGSLRFDPEGQRRNESRRGNFHVGQDLEREGIPVDHVLTDLTEQPSLPMEYYDGPQPSSKFGTRKRRVRHQDMQPSDRGE